LRRATKRQLIAAMICHLCLPAGCYVTGQTIHVNGGMLFAG
jgi:NAD(P)-dependent dehydrogenase (short-subunit alcohol dehydrogenase family)